MLITPLEPIEEHKNLDNFNKKNDLLKTLVVFKKHMKDSNLTIFHNLEANFRG